MSTSISRSRSQAACRETPSSVAISVLGLRFAPGESTVAQASTNWLEHADFSFIGVYRSQAILEQCIAEPFEPWPGSLVAALVASCN